jgi:hypothetical protein
MKEITQAEFQAMYSKVTMCITLQKDEIEDLVAAGKQYWNDTKQPGNVKLIPSDGVTYANNAAPDFLFFAEIPAAMKPYLQDLLEVPK